VATDVPVQDSQPPPLCLPAAGFALRVCEVSLQTFAELGGEPCAGWSLVGSSVPWLARVCCTGASPPVLPLLLAVGVSDEVGFKGRLDRGKYLTW